MLTETIAIQVEGSLPGARLCIYIQEKSRELRIKERPLILLCPGGGYEWTSDREAEPMAVQFLAMGCCRAALFLRAGGVPDSAFRAGGGDETDPCTRCGMGR